MARLGTAGANSALDGMGGSTPTNVLAYVALHVGDPSTTGANENAATGGYARQACSWNAAASGSKTNSSALTFSTAGSVAVTHFGTWTAVSAGSYGIGGALSASVTAASITVAAGALSISAS